MTANRGEVVAEPAGEFDEAQSDGSRAVINQAQNLFGFQTAIALARHLHFNAEFAPDPHPGDDVGREFAIGGDDVVARAPINAIGDHRQASRGVRREGNLVGAGVDQLAGEFARVSNRVKPVAEINRAVFQHIARMRLHSFVNRQRDGADGGVIEIDVIFRYGEKLPNLLIHKSSLKRGRTSPTSILRWLKMVDCA
ncbi:MAG: hypothetical protein JMDDDDMK_02966 [Acidobacteria bacterium]|nr:hypothetical protein [Acidobacteriota bacterium]